MHPVSPIRAAAPPGVSVVIPCLNEERSIAAVVEQAQQGIRATGLPGEVIVVDNGSTDLSAELARGAGARVIAEPVRGYGAALRRGFAAATYEYLVMGDGDLTYDLTEIPRFVSLLEEGRADLVVGNRWGDLRAGAMPALHRYLGTPFLSLMLRVMFRTRTLRDMHCGMRALTRSRWLELGCVTDGMEFASEMIVRAAQRRLNIAEIPIAYHPRVGVSKLSPFRDGWRHLRFMLLHSPTWALIIPGAALWISSAVILALIALGNVTLHGRIISIHTMIFGGLLNVVSLQFLAVGLLSKAYAHVSGLRRDPLIQWLYSTFTFERLVLYTLPLVLAGFLIAGWVVLDWARGGFGPLDRAEPLLVGVLMLIDGTQLWAAGYLLSVMGFPRPRLPDPGARADG